MWNLLVVWHELWSVSLGGEHGDGDGGEKAWKVQKTKKMSNSQYWKRAIGQLKPWQKFYGSWLCIFYRRPNVKKDYLNWCRIFILIIKMTFLHKNWINLRWVNRCQCISRGKICKSLGWTRGRRQRGWWLARYSWRREWRKTEWQRRMLKWWKIHFIFLPIFLHSSFFLWFAWFKEHPFRKKHQKTTSFMLSRLSWIISLFSATTFFLDLYKMSWYSIWVRGSCINDIMGIGDYVTTL